MEIGDKVAFTRGFLQSTAQYTGPEAPCCYGPFARGEIVENSMVFPPFVYVRWADGRESRVNSNNLAKVSRLQFEDR